MDKRPQQIFGGQHFTESLPMELSTLFHLSPEWLEARCFHQPENQGSFSKSWSSASPPTGKFVMTARPAPVVSDSGVFARGLEGRGKGSD